jgi:hypothetical protein
MQFSKDLFIFIENHGLGVVFMTSMLVSMWRYGIPYLKENTLMLIELKKYFEKSNRNMLTGKGLEEHLVLRINKIRWTLQAIIIRYIEKNNLQKNWNIIKSEIDYKFEDKKQSTYTQLKDLIDKSTLKIFMNMLDEELKVTLELMLVILEDLSKYGQEEHELYQVAIRSVEIHFEHFENKMNDKIKQIFE